MNPIVTGASVVTAIGVIGGGALTLDKLHAKQAWATSHESQHRVGTIFQLAERSRQLGNEQWLCDALEKEFIQLCSESPNHYLCEDPNAKRDILQKAGC